MRLFKFVVSLVLLLNLCACKMSKEIVRDVEKDMVVRDFKEDIWYLTVDQKKGSVIDLFVKEIGVGDTVVVVHGGFGAEHSYLTDLLESLYSKYHFVYYDQRGSLRSPVKHDSLITASAHIDDLEKLRVELGVEKLNLLGHSMGTWISSAYLERYPDRVDKMALLGLVWPKPNMTEEEAKINAVAEDEFGTFLSRPSIAEMIEKEGFNKRSGSSRIATYKWRIKFASTAMVDIANWRDMKGGLVFYNQAAGTAAGTTMPEDYDWIELYKNNPNVKISVINGSHDFVDFGGRLHSKWLKDIPNVEYNYIQDAAHNAWLDEPVKVQGLIDNFFNRN